MGVKHESHETTYGPACPPVYSLGLDSDGIHEGLKGRGLLGTSELQQPVRRVIVFGWLADTLQIDRDRA